MVQVLEDLQALRHDAVCAMALDVRNETHTAGVVLAVGAVEPVLAAVAQLGGSRHGARGRRRNGKLGDVGHVAPR